MLDHNLVLKADELFLVGDISTDGSGERATGLYLRDTRHLSRFRFKLNGLRLDRLAARTHAAAKATVTVTNPALPLANGDPLRPHAVALTEEIGLDGLLEVRLRLQNFAGRPLSLTLTCELASDFRDLFDIRGFVRPARGTLLRPELLERGAVLRYRGLDGGMVETAVSFDRPVDVSVGRLTAAEPELVSLLPGYDEFHWEPAAHEVPAVTASFAIDLDPGGEWPLTVRVEPRAVAEPFGAVPAPRRPEPSGPRTSNPFFDGILSRGLADLAALETTFPHGALPAAGIPWYIAPFGRDSLIVGLQTVHLRPAQAAGTLRVLAALQGRRVDSEREEEPGKILHEMRYGEMARLHEVPHTPYYGTLDATPLFVMLFAEVVDWTADAALYRELLPNVRRALEWIEGYGDVDGDGLVEYRVGVPGTGRVVHPVWKDSVDSLHEPDGAAVHGLVAPVEAQGYVYAAYRGLAGVAAAMGDPAWAADLRARAERVRERVEATFWLPDEGCYAQALAEDKRPIAAISSNPGHLLYCGLPTPERAAATAARLLAPDMDSGWGIRTLSARMASYNPMSYHNGSVWPHDNALIAAGLYRYGEFEGAHRVTEALFAAGRADPLGRLPELYCGFARTADGADAPVAYPVSCSPQAWAAGAMPLLLRAMLGLRIDSARRSLLVEPALPAWLDEIELPSLPLFGGRSRLRVRRSGTAYQVEGDGPFEVVDRGRHDRPVGGPRAL